MTDDRIDALWREATTSHGDITLDYVRWFARAVAALASAPDATQGEAVAWEYRNLYGKRFLSLDDPNKWHPHDQEGFKEFRALAYTTPQPTAPARAGRTPRVDALAQQWDDDGATRGSAFIEMRDLARELEREATQPAAAEQPIHQWPIAEQWAEPQAPAGVEARVYPLPDDLYPGSKDWLAADYAGRVDWLHTMYEAKKRALDAVLSGVEAAQQGQEDIAELRRLSSVCPELNLSNYGPDDVDELNGWAIEVAQCIDRAFPVAQKSHPQEGRMP